MTDPKHRKSVEALAASMLTRDPPELKIFPKNVESVEFVEENSGKVLRVVQSMDRDISCQHSPLGTIKELVPLFSFVKVTYCAFTHTLNIANTIVVIYFFILLFLNRPQTEEPLHHR